jgi:predicted SnoaL-like aldol condensation-catalyzing enzyme
MADERGCPRPASVLTVQATQATVEANKAVVRRFIQEVHNEGKFAAFSELFAPSYVNHSAPANMNNREAREQAIKAFRAGAPDLHVVIDDMIAEGDKVALRWTTCGNRAGVSAHAARRDPTDRARDRRPRHQHLPDRQRADHRRMDRLGHPELGAAAGLGRKADAAHQIAASVRFTSRLRG